MAPEDDIRVLKGTSVDFQVAVENPDARTYSIHWTEDGLAAEEGEPLQRAIDFPKSGNHVIRATLVAAEGASMVEWTVQVENRAPVIKSVFPDMEHIDITQANDMTFRIEAQDPDGDDLWYTWSSTGLDLRDLAGPDGIVGLPCDDDEPYTVSVTVTDGEDEATWAWTVRPEPPEPPVNHAPVLNAAHPSDDPVVIYKASSIDYSVEAFDEDGDQLTYVWGSSLLTLDGRNADRYLMDCPCDEQGQYTVWVIVSDGQESVRAEWTVKTRPGEEAPDLRTGDLPIGLIIAIIAASSAAAIAYIYRMKTKDGNE